MVKDALLMMLYMMTIVGLCYWVYCAHWFLKDRESYRTKEHQINKRQDGYLKNATRTSIEQQLKNSIRIAVFEKFDDDALSLTSIKPEIEDLINKIVSQFANEYPDIVEEGPCEVFSCKPGVIVYDIATFLKPIEITREIK